MRGMFEFVALGSVAMDPEMGALGNGTSRLRCRCVSNIKVKKGDQWVDDAVWYDLTFWGTRAEKIAKYMVKGCNFSVRGETRNNSYEKNGITVHTYQFHPNPNTLIFLPDRKDHGGTTQRQPPADNAPPPAGPPPATTGPRDPVPRTGGTVEEVAGEFPGDDDLPF